MKCLHLMAVNTPDGVAVMQIADEGEITRMTREYGVLECLIE